MTVVLGARIALRRLYDSIEENGSNCAGREDEFSDGPLPSDGEAFKKCQGCASYGACEDYVETGDPTYGVWAGRSIGRELDEDD